MKIGLTGSLSSGKSTALKILAKRKYPIFSADKEVKKLYQQKSLILKLSRKLNINIKSKQHLKKLIIKKKIKIKSLEKIINPKVRSNMKKFIIKNRNKENLLFEIPLLIESKLMKYFDILIFLSARKNIRLRRFLKTGGNKELFRILDNRQMKPNKKKHFCHHVVQNNKSLKTLKKNINRILLDNE
tara:strand:- start:312 stop:869 length:558 start_codon:yes stop_codon:yes gene_type:complete